MMIELHDFSFAYPSSSWVLRNVNLRIDEGENVLIYGPSGHGKSTLGKAISGIVPYLHGGTVSGHLRVNGISIRQRENFATEVTYIPQDPEAFTVMTTVWAEISAPYSSIHGLPLQVWPEVRDIAGKMGIEHILHRSLSGISGGELQRVSIASGLIMSRPFVIADEPISQQSPAGIERTLSLVNGIIIDHRISAIGGHVERYIYVRNGRVKETSQARAERWEERWRKRLPLPSQGGTVMRLRDVDFSYASARVIKNAEIDIKRGITIIEGENGSGKSTLARLMAGLLKPQGGRIETYGRAVLLLQDTRYYFTSRRFEDDMKIQCRVYGRPHGHCMRIMKSLGVRSDMDPHRISTGQRIRAALALLLVSDAEVLILDEPTRGLDPKAKYTLAKMMASLARNKAVVIMTHDTFLRDILGGERYILRNGRIEECPE